MKRSVLLLFVLVVGSLSLAVAQDVWLPQLSISKPFRDAHAYSANVVWALAQDGQLFRTTNGGTTWNSMCTLTFADHACDLMVLDEQKVLVSGNDAVKTLILRTTNAGTKWDTVFAQENGHISTMLMRDNANGMALGKYPVSGRSEFYETRTTDGGITWAGTANTPVGTHANQSPFDLIACGSTHMWFLPDMDPTYFISEDGGNSWGFPPGLTFDGYRPGPHTPYPYILAFNDENHGVMGLYEYDVAWTANGGQSWTHVAIPSSGPVRSVVGYGNWYFAARGGFVFSSKDQGHTWVTSYSGGIGQINKLTLTQQGGVMSVWAFSDIGGIIRLGAVGVDGQDAATPPTFSLGQNYPNPFNGLSNIGYRISESAMVRLTVTNLLGQEVAVLVNEQKAPGVYHVQVDAARLPSGVYLYRLMSGTFFQTRRMVLVR
jgi:photosystem II stability/assembly factor-like uncharacterized protein